MNARQFLEESSNRRTTSLFKGFLVLLEDLYTDHSIEFSKLKRSLPDEYWDLLDQANYFNKDKLQYLRKKTLDLGNEIIRESQNDFGRFSIEFNFK